MIKTWNERIVTANPPYVDPEEINKAMLEEIDELREAFANLHSDYDIIEIDREELRAKLAEKTESEKKWIALHGAVCDLHDKAKLAALDAQEKLAALEVLYLNSLADATQWQLYKSRKDAVIAAGMGKKALRDSAAGAAAVQRMTGAALASQEPVAEVLLVDGEKVIDASMAFFDSVELGTKLYLAAGAAPVQQVFGGRVDPSYVSGPMEAAPAAKVPEEPRIDINDLSGMIAAVIKEQTP